MNYRGMSFTAVEKTKLDTRLLLWSCCNRKGKHRKKVKWYGPIDGWTMHGVDWLYTKLETQSCLLLTCLAVFASVSKVAHACIVVYTILALTNSITCFASTVIFI